MVGASTWEWFLGVLLVVVLAVLWIYCLFDLLARPNRDAASKALWALALVLLAPFAIVAYLLVGRRSSSAD